ncbi:MAG: hypothetical protein R2788_13010 [Saprospiraceae bacterium]
MACNNMRQRANEIKGHLEILTGKNNDECRNKSTVDPLFTSLCYSAFNQVNDICQMNTEQKYVNTLYEDNQTCARHVLFIASNSRIEIIRLSRHFQFGNARAYSLKPDVILMDIDMPGRSGIDATLIAKQLLPQTRWVMLDSGLKTRTKFSNPSTMVHRAICSSAPHQPKSSRPSTKSMPVGRP